MKSIFALLIATTLLLVSCKEDDNGTNPTDETQSEYLPLAEGSTWTYEEYGADEDGNPNGALANTYTLTAEEKTTIEGRTGYKISSSAGNDEESVIASTSEGIFIYAPEAGETGIGFSVDIGWIQLYKENAQQWESYSANVDITIPFKVKADFQSMCYKMQDLTVDINGNTYDAVKFMQITDIEGEMEFNGEKESLNSKDTTEYVLAKGVGIYSVFTYGDYSTQFPIPGSIEILKSFELK